MLLVSDVKPLDQKWLKISAQFFFVLCHSLLIDLGHNQQQHPFVHGWGGRRVAVAVAVDVSDM